MQVISKTLQAETWKTIKGIYYSLSIASVTFYGWWFMGNNHSKENLSNAREEEEVKPKLHCMFRSYSSIDIFICYCRNCFLTSQPLIPGNLKLAFDTGYCWWYYYCQPCPLQAPGIKFCLSSHHPRHWLLPNSPGWNFHISQGDIWLVLGQFFNSYKIPEEA